MANRSITPLAILIVLLGSLFYCYELFGQFSPSIMYKQLMLDFNVNATFLGVLSSTFYYSYTIFPIPAGLLLDRFGARLILTIVIAICALSAGFFGLTHSLIAAACARFLMGASSAFAFVGTLYLIIRWIPPRYVALFIGLTQTLGSLGAVMGNGPLAQMVNHFGWRHSMLIFSGIGLALALFVGLIVRNQSMDFTESSERPLKILHILHVISKNPQTWYIGIYSFLIWTPITAFAALWGVLFLQVSAHLSLIVAANGIAMLWIGTAIGSPLTGWISDILGRRCLPLAFVALLGLISMTTLIYVQNISIFNTYLLLFLVGLAISGQSLAFAVIRDNHHADYCGAANGLNNMIIVTSGFILQPFIGRLLDFYRGKHVILSLFSGYSLSDFHKALGILPVFLFLAIIMSLFFIRETHCHRHELSSE